MFTLKNILKNGGATISKAGEALNNSKGYQVSIKDMQIIKVKELRKKILLEMLANIPSDACLGIWIEKGLAYVDYSKYYTRKAEAMRVGKANKQISIFNWKTNEAVYCR